MQHGATRATGTSAIGPASARAGKAVRLVSWFGPAGAKTVELRHQLEDLASGRARVVSLIIDLDTRRPAGLPAGIRGRLG